MSEVNRCRSTIYQSTVPLLMPLSVLIMINQQQHGARPSRLLTKALQTPYGNLPTADQAFDLSMLTQLQPRAMSGLAASLRF